MSLQQKAVGMRVAQNTDATEEDVGIKVGSGSFRIDLHHACGVLGPRGQGHAGIVVGSHSHVQTGDMRRPLHVLEFVFVGCGDVDSL